MAAVSIGFVGLGYLVATQLEKLQAQYAYTPERLKEIEGRARANEASPAAAWEHCPWCHVHAAAGMDCSTPARPSLCEMQDGQRRRNANIQQMIQEMKEGKNQEKYDDMYWKVLGKK